MKALPIAIENPMRHRTTLLLPLIVLLVAGCDSPDDDDRPAFEVRDSSGVELVIDRQPERPLGLQEVLRVGVVEGDPDHEFEAVRALTVDPAGGFWVVDSNEGVRRYGADGRYQGSVGDRGRGPGQADTYHSATLKGERILLFGRPPVLQLFDTAGTLLASSLPRPSGNRRFIEPFGAAGDSWIMQEWDYSSGEALFRTSMTFFRTAGLDQPLDTVRTFEGKLGYRDPAGHGVGNASWFYGNPAFGADRRGRLFVSDSVRYRVESYDLQGRLVRVLSRAVEPRPFDAGWLKEMEAGFEDAQRSQGPAGEPIDRDRLGLDMAAATPDPPPSHLPFVDHILVGPEGELWVERADVHPRPALRAVAHRHGYLRHGWLPEWSAPQVFDVFEPDGRYRGTVEVPESVAPMAVSGDRLYGVFYDVLDVEHVVVFEIDG